MTKSEILSIINPSNTRLDSLVYDKYLVTLSDESQIVGCFAMESVLSLGTENVWKFLLAPNPMNLRFVGQDLITLKGEDIVALKRL